MLISFCFNFDFFLRSFLYSFQLRFLSSSVLMCSLFFVLAFSTVFVAVLRCFFYLDRYLIYLLLILFILYSFLGCSSFLPILSSLFDLFIVNFSYSIFFSPLAFLLFPFLCLLHLFP